MGKYIRDFIEYSGISTEIPQKVQAFKNISTEGIFKLSDKKPGIHTFLKCSVKGDIYNHRIIDGVIGEGADGKKLTGMKCSVEGDINCRIEYTAVDGSNLIYSDRVSLPIVTSVPLTEDYFYSNNIIANFFIDDIYLEMLDDREYIVSVTGIVVIED
ncbi:MAG: hypothetical protein ACRC7N_02250 [Clostridium sp.]